jgi:hypothetical protein
MDEIQSHKSDEISALDQIKYEYPSFIIEIAEDPISNERVTTIRCGLHSPLPTGRKAIPQSITMSAQLHLQWTRWLLSDRT